MNGPAVLFRSRESVAKAIYDLRVERVRLALAAAVADNEDRRRAAAAEGERVSATLRTLAHSERDTRLAARLGLSRGIVDFLWTCVALEVDPRTLSLAEKLGGLDVRRGATLALHAAAFDLDGAQSRTLAAALETGSPSLRAGLLVRETEQTVLPAASFRVPARVRAHLCGSDALDPGIERLGGRVAPPQHGVDDPARRITESHLERALGDQGDVLVVIEGSAGVGKGSLLAQVAGGDGRSVIALDMERWTPRQPLEAAVTAWWRECLLGDAVPLVAHVDAVPEPERRRLALLLDEIPGVLAVTARQLPPELVLRRPVLRVPVSLPSAATRRALWQASLGQGADSVDLDLLARRYRTGEEGIARAVRAARLLVAEGAPVDTAALVAGVRASIQERVGDLAFRVPVTQSWDDLVLPDDERTQIQALIARVLHSHRVLDQWGFHRKLPRGQGVAALFSGPPGTGKTMVAGLIAQALDLDLLQVDLSRVVSKWIGETEKQLGAVFDAAEAGHALLLFDEADSLFARRTEVNGANDRYANLEVNYLLQRIEAFGGMAILTTNLEAAIDPAVRRRLAAHIAFWPPSVEERTEMWRRAIPREAPLGEPMDALGLALEFPQMTGAHIRNAAVAAAFIAASDGAPIGKKHLWTAARGEYRAMGRVLGNKGMET
jgi:hypothetical protein